jgi:hypothetical protein
MAHTAQRARSARQSTQSDDLPDDLRLRMERAVESLLAALDMLDASGEDLEDETEDGDVDEDLEPEDDEPSLGSVDDYYGTASQERWVVGCCADLEEEHDGREPEVDEPSLGSVDDQGTANQERWASGSCADLEEEHDGREPTLGALINPTTIVVTARDADGRALAFEERQGDQTGWGGSSTSDAEEDRSDYEPNGDEQDGMFSEDDAPTALLQRCQGTEGL